MLMELPVLSSRFGFSDSNYNYDNTNANVGSHLSITQSSIDLAPMAKNFFNVKRALVPFGFAQGNAIF
jgi:hypothetical protein